MNDVTQGYTVGNCYLMSCFSSMALYPDLIQKMFYFKQGELQGDLNENGIYQIKVKQGMRDDLLKEVVSVGARIEKLVQE